MHLERVGYRSRMAGHSLPNTPWTTGWTGGSWSRMGGRLSRRCSVTARDCCDARVCGCGTARTVASATLATSGHGCAPGPAPDRDGYLLRTFVQRMFVSFSAAGAVQSAIDALPHQTLAASSDLRQLYALIELAKAGLTHVGLLRGYSGYVVDTETRQSLPASRAWLLIHPYPAAAARPAASCRSPNVTSTWVSRSRAGPVTTRIASPRHVVADLRRSWFSGLIFGGRGVRTDWLIWYPRCPWQLASHKRLFGGLERFSGG
jgi:hypothetical protein